MSGFSVDTCAYLGLVGDTGVIGDKFSIFIYNGKIYLEYFGLIT
jgi:hypothetical protein